MSLLRAIFRGLKDTYDQFFSMAKFSLLWWLCVVPVYVVVWIVMSFAALPGPHWWAIFVTFIIVAPFTVTLFSIADPRRFVSTPELGDALEVLPTTWKRGWGIAILTVPFLLALIWNTLYFGGTDHILSLLVPLWTIMGFILFVFTFYAFSTAGLMESGVRNAFRGAAFVLVKRPITSILLSLFLIVLLPFMTALVLPSVLVGPPLVALIVNRFALDAFEIEVIDPNSPTVERTDERSRGIEHDRGFFDRMRGSGNRR